MMKYFIILSAFFLISCNSKFWGTNTGNPDYTMPTDGSMPYVPSRLANKICVKLNSCFSQASVDTCYNQIINLAGYTSELGSTASAYSTLLSLANAEYNLTVTPNTTNYTNCTNAINDLSCSDPLIQNNYSTASPTNFSTTNLMFRASTACALIY